MLGEPQIAEAFSLVQRVCAEHLRDDETPEQIDELYNAWKEAHAQSIYEGLEETWEKVRTEGEEKYVHLTKLQQGDVLILADYLAASLVEKRSPEIAKVLRMRWEKLLQLSAIIEAGGPLAVASFLGLAGIWEGNLEELVQTVLDITPLELSWTH